MLFDRGNQISRLFELPMYSQRPRRTVLRQSAPVCTDRMQPLTRGVEMTIQRYDPRNNSRYAGIFAILLLISLLVLIGPVAAASQGSTQPVDLYDAWFLDINSYLPASFPVMFNGQ